MSLLPEHIKSMLHSLRSQSDENGLGKRLIPGSSSASPRLRPRQRATEDSMAYIWNRLRQDTEVLEDGVEEIADPISA